MAVCDVLLPLLWRHVRQLCLRLHPVPECTSAAVCSFPSLQSAVECVQVGVGWACSGDGVAYKLASTG